MTRLNQVSQMTPLQLKQFIIDCGSCKTCEFANNCDKMHKDTIQCHDGIRQWLATNDKQVG